MLLDLENIDYYYLTHNNNKRKYHMKNEFIKYNLFEINPNPLFNGNRCKSASSGFLKMLEIASNKIKTNFKPFVMLEDDAKKKDNYPDNIEIPDDCDLFYLGHSKYGINNTLIEPIFITVNDNIVKLINILSNTAIAICSIKGLLHMQKCMMTVFYENKPWDIPLANSIYRLNVYSTTEELIYQYGGIGGQEKITLNIPYLKKHSITDIPEFVFVNAKKLPLLVSNNLIKIKIFAGWTDCNTIYNKVIDEYDWKNDSKYGVEYIFTKQNDFTHAIIMNTIMPNISINKKNVIGLAQEPSCHYNFKKRTINDDFVQYCIKKVNKYFIGSTKDIQEKVLEDCFIEKISYQLPHISYKIVNSFIEKYPKKDKLINFVYSSKNMNHEGMLYKYRHELGNNILINNMPIDIYGSSTDNLKNKFPNKENIKYGFDWKDVHKVYENYKFSIVIENTREPEYISEKIFIPLLCGCIPIYLGSTNIDKYFKDYVIHLSGNVKDDLNFINSIINNPDKYYKKINIEDVKEKIHLKNIIHEEFL